MQNHQDQGFPDRNHVPTFEVLILAKLLRVTLVVLKLLFTMLDFPLL
ncbi:hypothetical protein [Spirosoma endbachense]|nr:hypothetical protein [Spirosoma endbachense]